MDLGNEDLEMPDFPMQPMLRSFLGTAVHSPGNHRSEAIRQVGRWNSSSTTEDNAVRTVPDGDLDGSSEVDCRHESCLADPDVTSRSRNALNSPETPQQIRSRFSALGSALPLLHDIFVWCQYGNANRIRRDSEKSCACFGLPPRLHRWEYCADGNRGLGQCYNVRYSPSGSLALAGYEHGAIDIFHNSSQRISTINRAHSDGVNCFCWLDSNRFVSCSDDLYVCLWDVRMPALPVQCVCSADLLPIVFQDEYQPDMWVKDLHFLPGAPSSAHVGTLIVSSFSPWINRLEVKNDFTLAPLAPCRMAEDVVRSALIPSCSQFPVRLYDWSSFLCGGTPDISFILFLRQKQMSRLWTFTDKKLLPEYVLQGLCLGVTATSEACTVGRDGKFLGNLLVSFRDSRKQFASYLMFTPGEDSEYLPRLPQYITPDPTRLTWLDDGKPAKRYARRNRCRSIKVDPTGNGILVRKTVHSDLRNLYSFTAYYTLEAPEKKSFLPRKIDMKFFIRDKTCDEYFQEAAFAPNGHFIASPQDRRVDILTNGKFAAPFSFASGEPQQFNLAASVALPKCGDILCCDVSCDNVSVACGCTMGHVHFLQPRFG